MSDRELDLLVAEHVRGWVRRGDDDWCYPLHRALWNDWENRGTHPRLEGPLGERYYLCSCQVTKGSRLPEPSGDLEEAWRLFLDTLDPNRTFLRPCGNGQDGLWWALYYDEEMVVRHPQVEVAICLWALWTKGVVPEKYRRHVVSEVFE